MGAVCGSVRIRRVQGWVVQAEVAQDAGVAPGGVDGHAEHFADAFGIAAGESFLQESVGAQVAGVQVRAQAVCRRSGVRPGQCRWRPAGG